MKLLLCVTEVSCLTSSRLSLGALLEVTSKGGGHQGGLPVWGSSAGHVETCSELYGVHVPVQQAPWLRVLEI